MRRVPEGEGIHDLAFAILERAADDRHSTHPELRADAAQFLEAHYPRDLYLTWVSETADVDIGMTVQRIMEV